MKTNNLAEIGPQITKIYLSKTKFFGRMKLQGRSTSLRCQGVNVVLDGLDLFCKYRKHFCATKANSLLASVSLEWR